MAVKFSQFTPATDFAAVDNIVGYAGTANIQIPPANLDTTYRLSTQQATNDVDLRLTGTKAGTAGTTEDVKFVAGTAISLTAGSDQMTIANTGVTSFTNSNGTYISAATANSNATGAVTTGVIDLSAVDGTSDSTTRFLSKDNTWDVPAYSSAFANWTVSDGSNSSTVSSGEIVTFTGGTGITSTESSRTVTLAIDYAGADNAILAASAATVVAADTIWFSDATDTTIKKGLVSDLPFNETLDEVTTAGNTTANTINVGGGTASVPGYGINNDPNTGMFSNGADILGLATGGAAALTVDATQNATFNSLGAVTLASGTTANRNDAAIIPTAVDGMIRYNTTTNGFEGYINGAWGSIGGGVTIDKKQFPGTGSQTVFNLASTAAGLTVNNLAIYISGVYQNKLDASDAANFTVGAGANPDVTFSTAPPLTAANGIEIVITR
ncbi:MAG TPA: hypothetical protein DEG69_17760 [Flavobacteriaceae bacterium]|nr:hypothetical protein [Flavobacteriaceae bacterium]